MPLYDITTAERWSMKVHYLVKARSPAAAVRRVRQNEVEPTGHSFLLNEEDDIEEILSIVSEDGKAVDVTPFNTPAS